MSTSDAGITPAIEVTRMGAEAMFDQAIRNGSLELALAAAVVAGDAPAQKLLSGARMSCPGGVSLVITENRFEDMSTMAPESPDRRLR